MNASPNQAHRPTIHPVDDGVSRPLWSVMIPTYNCAHYLRQTLASVLCQDPGPEVMQVQVVDDCSTQDDPAAVVAELGNGRVEFYRQPQNQGYIRNFETCLQRSHGHLIHLLHGDDYVLPNFYQQLQRGFEHHSDVGAAFCRHNYVNAEGEVEAPSRQESPTSGILAHWLERIAQGQCLATPSIVVRRSVYEHLGGFDRRFTCAGEDWEMWVRIAAHYPVWYEPEILAAYRVTRAGSLTASAVRSYRLVKDMRQAVEIIESYLPDHLPPSHVRRLLGQSRNMYASWALKGARELLTIQDWPSVQAQTQEALRCSRSAGTVWAVAKLRGQVWLSRMQQALKPWQSAEGQHD